MSKGDLEAIERQVVEIIEQTADTRSIWLDNADRRLPLHRAGQHVKVGVHTNDGQVWRSFSVSSAPTRPSVVELTVKRKPEGVVSNALHRLRPGDRLSLKGPSGRFVFDPDEHPEPLVLVVAGSGISPVMAILRTLVDVEPDRPVTLIYGCRTRQDLIFAREIEDLRHALPGLNALITLSRPDQGWTGLTGRVGPEMIEGCVDDPANARHYLCVPGLLHVELRDWLLAKGVMDERIHVELYGKEGKGSPRRAGTEPLGRDRACE
jgi:ferredoxin-NADP reductase